MIRRERSAVVIQCDGCGQYRRDIKYRLNAATWNEAKAAGWRSIPIKEGRDFKHYRLDCPDANTLSISG